jgi:hypothetical protein
VVNESPNWATLLFPLHLEKVDAWLSSVSGVRLGWLPGTGNRPGLWGTAGRGEDIFREGRPVLCPQSSCDCWKKVPKSGLLGQQSVFSHGSRGRKYEMTPTVDSTGRALLPLPSFWELLPPLGLPSLWLCHPRELAS